ncbi:MAG: patatin-like phospholipase family protein [Betaproteobacteria bacterium]
MPGQVVLVLQGGGALGAFQVGAYQSLHEAGIEPDWVIGTSIGAINGAIIAGNPPERRLERLHAFWEGLQQHAGPEMPAQFATFENALANFSTVMRGVPTFFAPKQNGMSGAHAQVGIEQAAYYSTAPLRDTLSELVDFDYLNSDHTRLTVGAVNARTGEMRYFDNRDETIAVEHIMASGALPPAFPAIRIDGEPYWDGGLYSNTPIEAVLDDNPRRNSLIFTVNLWNPDGAEPASLWEVMSREKDIQFASRAHSHILRQKQIHHLRHIIRELTKQVSGKAADSTRVRELASWGCGTVMHVVPLVSPPRDGEDQLKDIDFTPTGIRTRMDAGIAETKRLIERAPWRDPVDSMVGVIVHENL